MALFSKMFKQQKQPGSNDNRSSFGEDMSKLIDGELPDGWYAATYKFIKPRDQMVTGLYVKIHEATSIPEEKQLIEQFLQAFYSFKQECESRGECYIKYFDDMYEKCFNSSNPCFSMGEVMEERLKYINDNYSKLVEAEEKKKHLLSGLKDMVISEIDNNPGILQSDLVKKFDPLIKNEVTEMLYYLDKDGKLLRTKKGRTYILELK